MFNSPPEVVFKHNLVGRILLALPLVIYFIIVAAVASDESVGMVPWVIGVAGIGLYAWACVAIGKNRIEIHPEGLQQQGIGATKAIRWEEITETRYWQTPVANQVAWHFGLIGLIIALAAQRGGGGSQQMKVTGVDGTTIKLAGHYKKIADGIREVLRRVTPRLLDAARQRVRTGGSAQFGDLEISAPGLVWKGKQPPVPWSAISTYEIAGATFRVKQEGKWLNSISVPSQRIPNVLVALDLMDELKHGGQRQPDPLARVMKLGG